MALNTTKKTHKRGSKNTTPRTQREDEQIENLLPFLHKLMFWWCMFLFAAPIHLEGGRSRYEGRVELYHNGAWGTVCGKQFDELDARVVCRMLGKENL